MGFLCLQQAGVLLIVADTCCRSVRLQWFGLRAVGAHSVVLSGLSCSRHVGSSQTWGQTLVPCIGRRILNHWTARQVSPGSLCRFNSFTVFKDITFILQCFIDPLNSVFFGFCSAACWIYCLLSDFTQISD